MHSKETRRFDPMAINSMINSNRGPSSSPNTTQDKVHSHRRRNFQLPPLIRPETSRGQSEALSRPQAITIPLPGLHEMAPRSPENSETNSIDLIPYAIAQREPTRTPRVRAPRPKYTPEQGLFIWYHRTDLCEAWDVVISEFKVQFKEAREKGGLQCKFYRMLDQYGVQKVRLQKKVVGDDPKHRFIGAYGVIQRTSERFRWMRIHHQNTPALPQFRTRGHSPSSSVSCTGCPDCG